MSDDFLGYFDLGSELCVVEIYPKPDWVGKTLRQLRLRERMNINVVARKDEALRSELIDPNEPLKEGDRLIVVAEKADINELG